MENLNIQPTFNTPTISFNADTGKLFLKGRSIPEDPGEFYERIFHWLEEYFGGTRQETELEFQNVCWNFSLNMQTADQPSTFSRS